MFTRKVFALVLVVTLIATLVSAVSVFSQRQNSGLLSPVVLEAADRLSQDADGGVEITWNGRTGTPSFIRGRIPFSALSLANNTDAETAAFTATAQYADLFGIDNPAEQLEIVQSDTDALGMVHITMSQKQQGVPVYQAFIKVHLHADGQTIVAISNSFVPDLAVVEVAPQISALQAETAVQQALPNGIKMADPELLIYPVPAGSNARLVWLFQMQDNAIPVRNAYFVDAVDSSLLYVLENLQTDRDRQTYDAENGQTLPGTLARAEGDGPTGDTDVDDAHDFAGETYDYYFATHARDSYDNAGAAIISTANYGVGFANAFWNGSQMVYGDGFAIDDVVAHELTHAVTENSANLIYEWQSGALNESFSDIFGAMVDREDWLIGEDLPPGLLGGQDAIRDMADPARLGQPGHTDDWVATCSDQQGVHSNSGITNKAYYNIATSLGKETAELIFYRALTVYLEPNSTLEDARAGAIQSAQDLYGAGSGEETAVNTGFADVGLDGSWNPPTNSCSCAATTALADETIFADKLQAMQIAATLYRLRDQFSATVAGSHYRDLYETYTGQINALLLSNAGLRARGGLLLQDVAPGVTALLDSQGGDEVITQQLVDETVAYLEDLAAEARASGNDDLADTIEREMARIDWELLVGQTYEQAFEYLNELLGIQNLYLPLINR